MRLSVFNLSPALLHREVSKGSCHCWHFQVRQTSRPLLYVNVREGVTNLLGRRNIFLCGQITSVGVVSVIGRQWVRSGFLWLSKGAYLVRLGVGMRC